MYKEDNCGKYDCSLTDELLASDPIIIGRWTLQLRAEYETDAVCFLNVLSKEITVVRIDTNSINVKVSLSVFKQNQFRWMEWRKLEAYGYIGYLLSKFHANETTGIGY